MPGTTRSAATTARRRSRSVRSTSGGSALELCARILVDEPPELAIRQGRPDQLRREDRRQLRAIQYRFQRIGLAGAADEEQDFAAGVEDRRGERQPGRIQFRNEVRDGEVLVLGEGRGVGKEGGRMPVIAHAKQHEVEARDAIRLVERVAEERFVRGSRFPR